jgi:tripartite-type tricarboxylate transporter receptor subunit TctC
MSIVRGTVVLLMALIAGAPAPTVFAQAYPARPVEFVIPFAPGGPDLAIRLIQPTLSANLGAPVVLVNKAGGGGAIGMDLVAKARPDGYTLAATVRSTLTILPATQPDVTYRISDFTPIVERLTQALSKTVKDPAVVAVIEKAGLQIEYNDPAATLKLVERENEVVRTAARKLGLAK